jgi:hypothetical protein
LEARDLIDSIILFLQSVSADLIYDVGLIVILAAGLLAIVVFDFWLILVWSGKTKRLAAQLESLSKKMPVDFANAKKMVIDSGLPVTCDIWLGNSGSSPSDNKIIGWKQADHLELAETVLAASGFRSAAILMPGLIVLISVLAGAAGAFIQMAVAESSGADAWQSSWQKTLFLIIAGIIVAVVFYLVDGLFERLAVKKARKLFDVTAELLPVISKDDWRSVHLYEIRKNNEMIAAIESRIVKTLVRVSEEHLLPDLKNSYKAALEQYLLPEVQQLRISSEGFSERILQLQDTGMRQLAESFHAKLSGSIEEQLSRQVQLTDKLEQMQQAGADRISQMLENSDESIAVQKSLNQHALDTIEALGASRVELAAAAEKLNSGMEQASQLAESMNQLLEADRQLIMDLVSEREAMQSINNGYFDKMNSQMLQLQDDLNSEIANLFSRFTDIYTATFENIDEQTGNLLENFENQTRTLIENMDEQVRDITFLTKDVNAEIADLNHNLQSSSAGFSDSLVKSLNGYLHDMESSVAELMEKLADTTEMIRNSVDDLPAAVLLARMSIDGSLDNDSDDLSDHSTLNSSDKSFESED